MALFKNFVQTIKSLFSKDTAENAKSAAPSLRSTIADYQHATAQPQTAVASDTGTVKSDIPQTNIQRQAQQSTEVSDIVPHTVEDAPCTQLDILVDALGLSRKRIVSDRGVVSVPFDASGCDFGTQRQLAKAIAVEYNLIRNAIPTNIACTELAKRVFGSIKASREECFICGYLLVAVNQDIDSDGYMLAEVTNTHNGNSVSFDIPAQINADGVININYDLIAHNLLIARDKTL